MLLLIIGNNKKQNVGGCYESNDYDRFNDYAYNCRHLYKRQSIYVLKLGVYMKLKMSEIKNLVESKLNELPRVEYAGYAFPHGYFTRQNDRLYFEEQCKQFIKDNKIEVINE